MAGSTKSRFVLAVLLAATAFAGGGEAASAKQLLHVPVQAAKLQQIAPSFEVSGLIEAKEQVSVSFRVSGEITERNISIGQSVAKDTIIARLDPSSEEQDLVAAKAALEAAQAQRQLAQSTYDRQQALFDKGTVPRAAFEAAKEALKVKQAAVEQAQSNVSLAAKNLDFTSLKAGVDGRVTDIQIETGQYVQPGQPVATIAANKGIQAVFDVPTPLIDQGNRSAQSTEVWLASNPAIKAHAQLAELSPVVDGKTGTVRVKMDVIDPPTEMALGLPVVARAAGKPVDGFTFPVDALGSLDGTPALWVVDRTDMTVHLTPVTLIGIEGAEISIGSGISDGDWIVSAGTQFLSEGQKIAADLEG